MNTLSRKELDPFRKEHEEMLYPTVRLRTEKAGGSGTIIYSRPVPDEKGQEQEYETYVLTNHHVVEDAIVFKKKWDPIARREKTEESRTTVQVEIFEYKHGSSIIGSTAYDGDIKAWDKDEDLALVKLRTVKPFKFVAKLYPKGKEEDIKLFAPTYAVGASLGHSPIPTKGELTSKSDEIDNKNYWMSTSQIIFGNSGGSMYLAETHELIGVPARISGYQAGFSIDVVTHMGFFVPVDRIYSFLDDQFYQFIYDPKLTSKDCDRMRKEKEELEEKKLLLPEPEITKGRKEEE